MGINGHSNSDCDALSWLVARNAIGSGYSCRSDARSLVDEVTRAKSCHASTLARELQFTISRAFSLPFDISDINRFSSSCDLGYLKVS